MANTRILLVDDDATIRFSLKKILELRNFEVDVAAGVNEALRLIGSQTFDVLLTDLRMPDPDDGLIVVGAMRHANPKTVTLIFSAYPEMREAAASILLEADEVLEKPLLPDNLVKTITALLARKTKPAQTRDSS